MIIVVLLVLGVGLLALYITLRGYFNYKSFLKQAQKTEGLIVDKKKVTRYRYVPVVEFTDHKGRTVRVREYLWSVPVKINIGSPITIYYDPKQPKKRAAVASGPTGGIEMIVAIGFEIIIVLFGLLLAYGYFTGQI